MPTQLMISSIFEKASVNPNKAALVCGTEHITYEKLAAKIRSTATFLRGKGIQRHDRVLLATQNADPTFAYGYFACHLLGAIAVPIDPKIGRITLLDITNDTAPKLCCGPHFPELNIPQEPLDCFNRDYPLFTETIDVGLDDVADILFTAGTTGKSKGIMQTHRNIAAFARGRRSFIGERVEDKLILPLPLSHGFGLGRLRSAMSSGGSIILVDGFSTPERFFYTLKEHQASGFCTVPSGLATLLQLTGDKLAEFRDQLSYIETAAAPLPHSVKVRLVRLLPKTNLYNTYGLTEATSTIAFIDLHQAKGEDIPVGKPVEGVQINVIDEGGEPVPSGTAGRVIVRGENVMKGYWCDVARTEEVLADGWLRTNDIGFIDGEGQLHLTSRKEEVLNVGGKKLAPAEIEHILDQHPAVKECACIGVTDPLGLSGETIVAYLVARQDAAEKPDDLELINLVRAATDPYKIPSQFVWIDELPKNSLGKIQRLRLRERLITQKAKPRGNIIDLVRETFALKHAVSITDEDGPGTLDGWDSLGNVKLILAIQDSYNITIEPADVINMETIGDIRSMLRSKGISE